MNPWLNTRQAAAHLGVSLDTIRRAVRARELTCNRNYSGRGQGARIYVRLEDLERWFRQRCPEVRAL